MPKGEERRLLISAAIRFALMKPRESKESKQHEVFEERTRNTRANELDITMGYVSLRS